MGLGEIRGWSPYKDTTLQQCIAKWIEVKKEKKNKKPKIGFGRKFLTSI